MFQQASDLKAGMDIFGIPQPAYKELAATERDLDLLEKIWVVVDEWNASYSSWKDGKFRDIKVNPIYANYLLILKPPHGIFIRPLFCR